MRPFAARKSPRSCSPSAAAANASASARRRRRRVSHGRAGEAVRTQGATMSDGQLPSHARVVIIGGGIVGASIAYHLTKLGWTDVLLLERRDISCGTTW